MMKRSWDGSHPFAYRVEYSTTLRKYERSPTDLGEYRKERSSVAEGNC
jgi:hypothetical protein